MDIATIVAFLTAYILYIYITYHICTYCIAVLFIVQKHVPMYSTHLIHIIIIESLLKDTAYKGHITDTFNRCVKDNVIVPIYRNMAIQFYLMNRTPASQQSNLIRNCGYTNFNVHS